MEFDLDSLDSYNNIVDLIADKHLVLLGEATHGSLEFYEVRAKLTRLLTEEKGFDAVCIEGDWPNAALVNSYINGYGDKKTPETALNEFKRFPQ